MNSVHKKRKSKSTSDGGEHFLMSLLLCKSVEVTKEEKDSLRTVTYGSVQSLTFSQDLFISFPFRNIFFSFSYLGLRRLGETFWHDCHKLILLAKDNGSVTLNRFPAKESVLPGLVL